MADNKKFGTTAAAAVFIGVAATIPISYSSTGFQYRTMQTQDKDSAMKTIDVAKFIDVKFEALEARVQTKATATDGKPDRLMDKLSSFDDMRDDISKLDDKIGTPMTKSVLNG